MCIESIHLGPVEDPKNLVGAVIDLAARQKILDYIAIGKTEGTLLVQREYAPKGIQNLTKISHAPLGKGWGGDSYR